jgi:ribonuclease-3
VKPDAQLAELQRRIGYVFQDTALLETAMTHSSLGAATDNERLEFLGDRVLNLIMAQELYSRFPDEREGDLARRHAALVQASILAVIARKLDLGAALHFSSAERAAGGGGNENILADSMEALLGALFLDAGLDECRHLIVSQWGEEIYTLHPPRDAKTSLQEWAQARDLGLPEYRLIAREGPDHAPQFEIEAVVEGFAPVRATGASRRKAEKDAAALLLALVEGGQL